MKLTFHGGVKEVTGANYLLESGDTKILIDCGLAQGGSFSEKHNWGPFPYNPKDIDAVFPTHAHVDHTGRLPKLVKEGFRGKVYSTPPTRDFANLLLLDSEHVLMDEAERFKLPPLYGVREVEELMAKWEGVPYHQEISVGPMKVTLYNAGHILGSSIVLVEVEGKKIVFSGDLGNSPAPIIGPYDVLEEADYCIVESTYGDRIHGELPQGAIEDVIEDTIKAGGVLMIPAFAMERTQKLLFDINELIENKRVPPVQVFLDSPLAIKVTDVYKKYKDYFDEATMNILRGDNMLFDFPGLKKALSTEESRAINEVRPPKVIIAGSGMSNGGRILHHEKRYFPDPNSTILFIGYQARGSLGRKIQEGVKTVKIHGEEVLVRCKAVSIHGYSAHADQRQLLSWLHPMRFTLKKVFVVQGEDESSSAFVQRVINDLAVEAAIPEEGKPYEL
ncbi:MAG: MBL fold metallo-hydrolase [Candidatus Harrisonbacteria bacterium]|nr:MBL fold metallo-hydrolase [Candidatus Harrisonbacteria bacterium]